MKQLLSLCGVLLSLATISHAELRVPSSVYTMEELEKAKAEAAEEKEPLIFVYTDPGTT